MLQSSLGNLLPLVLVIFLIPLACVADPVDNPETTRTVILVEDGRGFFTCKVSARDSPTTESPTTKPAIAEVSAFVYDLASVIECDPIQKIRDGRSYFLAGRSRSRRHSICPTGLTLDYDNKCRPRAGNPSVRSSEVLKRFRTFVIGRRFT